MSNLILTNGKKSLNGMKRILLLVVLAVAAALPVEAQTQYVFMNGSNYYYVNNNTWSNTTTFSPNVIWSITGNVPYNNNRYLIISRGGYMGNRTYTPSLSATSSATYTFTISDGNYVNYGGRYLATTLAQMSTGTAAGSRITAYRVTTANVPQTVVDGTVTTPTITPSAAQTIEYDGSLGFTASATGTQTVAPAHTTYTFNSTTYYYYNNRIYNNVADFAQNSSATPTYTWALSGDGASGLELMSTTGENTIVRYTGSASGTTATLTVTAKVGTETRTASVTINVTPVEPTAISATGTTVYVTGSGAVAYTLTPDYAYNRVNVASSNTGVFTVTSPATTGGVDITPVAPGMATLTLTALNSDGSNGPSTSVTVTVRDICAAPEFAFSQSGSSVVATLTCATLGATIRYTTDGTDPTPTTGTVYSGPFTSANGQTIKAIAVLGDYYDASAVATKTVNPIDYVEQGVSGGIVTINDLEDHTWTYYSGVSSDLDGGNYNTNYLGKLYSPNPRNVKITYQANGGAVSIDESETEFVYYKTLEESATSGEYAYQVISNPFSKRPNGKGFGGWKIKEGADYIQGYADEATLPLDAEIVFNNLPYSSVNCVSAEIVLEATWVNLNDVTYASGNTITYNVSGGNYETNILVLNRNVTGTITTSSPVTIMMVEPDGSRDYRGTYTFTGNITTNNTGVSKIEYASWNPSGNIDARGRSLTIGRGMNMGGTTRALVGTAQTSGMNQVLKVESGSFTTFTSYTANPSSITKHWVVLGCDYDRATGDNSKLEFTGRFLTGQGRNLGLSSTDDMVRVWSKSGSFMTGVDVANADAENSYYLGITNTHNRGHRYMEIEGGEWYANITGGMGENHTTTDPAFTFRMKGGIVRGSLYGAAAWATAAGLRTYVITGGTIRGWVAGGANGTSSDEGATNGTTYIYVGGNAEVNSNGSTAVINRAVGGNVFGAGCGYSTTSTSGQVTYGTNVVVADNAYVERGVYGGGSYGYTTATANLYILGGTVGGQPGGVNGTSYNADITGGVYGGACQNRGGTVNIYMNGGLVQGGVYGGSNADGTIAGTVTMHIDGGQVGTPTQHANIHGGGYGSNTVVDASIDLTLGKEDCNATSGVTVYGDVYGGSAEGEVNTTSPDLYYTTTVTLYHGTIYGGLYGGGLGSATHAADVNGDVAVKVYGGSVRTNDGSGENGSGGVFGCNNTNGSPQRSVTVDIYRTDPAPDANSFALFAVYGGGNRSDYTGTPVVTIHGCSNSIEYVYGGGNASAVRGTDVTIWGGHIGNAFGGGNGFSVTGNHDNPSALHYNPGANITADGANLTIHGGTIDAAFGGSNQWGYINGGITVTVAEQDEPGNDPCTGSPYTPCSNLIVELYGGGNQAPAVTSGDVYIIPNVTISSCDMQITNLFGGAKNANHGADINLEVTNGQFQNVFGGNNLGGTITGNVTLTLKGGTMVNAFGGNNQGGSITGTITVLVDSTGTDCPLKVDNVYGGGNEAAYSPNDPTAATPTVNFVNGTVRNAVFGGGLGSAAKITANPTVNIGGTGSKHAIVGGTRIDGTPGVGNVYGGGSQADVLKDGDNTGNTSVTLSGNAVVKGNVYGGGNQADVQGNTNVELR
jgi:hypothetical protein